MKTAWPAEDYRLAVPFFVYEGPAGRDGGIFQDRHGAEDGIQDLAGLECLNSTIRNHSRKVESKDPKAILFVIKYLKQAFLHLHFIGKLL